MADVRSVSNTHWTGSHVLKFQPIGPYGQDAARGVEAKNKKAEAPSVPDAASKTEDSRHDSAVAQKRGSIHSDISIDFNECISDVSASPSVSIERPASVVEEDDLYSVSPEAESGTSPIVRQGSQLCDRFDAGRNDAPVPYHSARFCPEEDLKRQRLPSLDFGVTLGRPMTPIAVDQAVVPEFAYPKLAHPRLTLVTQSDHIRRRHSSLVSPGTVEPGEHVENLSPTGRTTWEHTLPSRSSE